MIIYTLYNDKDLIVRVATEEDTSQILNLMDQIGGESEFLTYGRKEFGMTEEQQKKMISLYDQIPNMLYIVGEYGGQIIGVLNFAGGNRERISHCGMFGMGVLKKYWGIGVGTALVDYMLDWAEEGKMIKKIELQVKIDNDRAIALYKKMGFIIEGQIRRSIKIKDKYYDTLYMGKIIE